MSSIVLKSFAELANVFDLDALPAGPADEPLPAERPHDPHPDQPEPGASLPTAGMLDLSDLLGQLEAAGSELAAAHRRDQEARDRARAQLDHYDALLAQVREAELGRERAAHVRREAEALLATAFTDDSRAAADRVVRIATEAETSAARLVEERRREAEALAARVDLQRLLDDRQRQEEAALERARAAELENARRLSEGLARARETLEMGQVEEAQAMLGDLSTDFPDSAEVASLLDMITWRARSVKLNAAEAALREARRVYRHDPAGAVTLLAAVDVDGLPEPLARQVFGEWARACSRRFAGEEREVHEPLRYAPDPGRGAVLVRERPDGAYVVASALGMGAAWRPGSVVPDRLVRRARPLR